MLDRTPGKEAAQYTSALHDGRFITVSVQPMPDGGTVTTHQDITEQRRSEAKIAHMALHDALTGLPNRVLLERTAGVAALARLKGNDIVAVHLLDLDLFKNVNDTLGHPAGDKLLKMVTARLRARVSETDTVARMGGDEFAIVQTSITQPVNATTLALRIIDALSEPYEIDGQQVIIGTSVGIAVGPADGRRPRPVAAQRRPCPLPRQGRRPWHLLLLRAGDGRADAGAARHGIRSAPSAGGRRVRAALPADRQSRSTTRSAASKR